MRHSMTGFASVQGGLMGASGNPSDGIGDGDNLQWIWELRGVNGKGLDLRLRLPDWIEGLEASVRKSASDRLSRGNVQISLKIQSDDSEPDLRLDSVHLQAYLHAIAEIEQAALGAGVSLSASSAADIVGLRGVLTTEIPERDIPALRSLIMIDFGKVLDAFCAARQQEGAALLNVMTKQLDEIEGLVGQAVHAAKVRQDLQKDRLKVQVSRLLEANADLDENRLAQELALLAVKADITEELDRLVAHVAAARDLLAAKGAIGRKLDFLMQEFNREANTLCSKSQNTALTQIGLSLKIVIDQLREQVQNVE